MRYLKKYESHEEIDVICQKYGIKNYNINGDGSIDIDGNVKLDNKYFSCAEMKLTKLPLKFRSVSGFFSYEYNNLTSLVGCPKSVGGYFSCESNDLANLIGCPKSVGDDFFCGWNKIETFEGLEFINIGNVFNCYCNPIYEVWKLFHDHTKFEFFNDCDPIREDRVIILDRLNFFLDYINKPTVTEVDGYKCI